MALLPELLDAAADLLLGSACASCRRPGRPLCPTCRASLPGDAVVAWPTPAPDGLAPPYACGPYEDRLQALVLGHKEHRVLALARPLGTLLATAVRAAIDGLGVVRDAPVLLVPVPSRPAVVRQRGHDATLVMTRHAARRLAGEGRPVTVARVLRTRPGLADQAGLDAAARGQNLAGSMTCPSRLVLRHAGQRAHVVVCDDVVTTGATAREAQRALEAAGVPVLAVAAVAATRRRLPPRDLGPQ